MSAEWEFIDFARMAAMQEMADIMALQILLKAIEEKPFGVLAGDNWNRLQMVCQQ